MRKMFNMLNSKDPELNLLGLKLLWEELERPDNEIFAMKILSSMKINNVNEYICYHVKFGYWVKRKYWKSITRVDGEDEGMDTYTK